MLGKLVKLEFRQTGRIFLPMFGGAMVLLGLTKLMFMLTDVSAVKIAQAGGEKVQANGVLTILSGVFLMMLFLALIALCVGTLIVAAQRFYRMLGDEGYLMFTLPVTPAQHIWAKLIAAFVWTLAAIAFSLFSALVLLSLRIGFLTQQMNLAMAELTQTDRNGLMGLLVLMSVFFLVGVANTLLMVYTSCAVGAHWPQQRLTASILTYFGIQFGVQILMTGVMFVVSSILFVNESAVNRLMYDFMYGIDANPWPFVYALFAGALVLVMLGNVIYFAVTRHLLSKKLNLA